MKKSRFVSPLFFSVSFRNTYSIFEKGIIFFFFFCLHVVRLRPFSFLQFVLTIHDYDYDLYLKNIKLHIVTDIKTFRSFRESSIGQDEGS